MSVSRQEKFLTSGRQNQKQRTREALLDAAVELARDGRSPSIAEVAETARVSPATAYRYFPNTASLWADVASRQHTQARDYPGILESLSGTAEERMDTVVRSTAEMQLADETVWRTVLRAALDRWFDQLEIPEADRVPVRGTTRLEMARIAIAPLADRLTPEQLDRLANALTMVYGMEAVVTARDTCGLDTEATTETMRWAARALIRGALAETEDVAKS
ncbi:TetR/AcrR family transcriptional regulator [Nocardia huaxiensis]|uniref:TetR/AcrR family transcriptional regulator n=1 Tax=Nocardia huaxiensis TaxID=2755382 RepID=A0A7D6VF35_9NOCA|nr:TetR/AcrR family transcriptional regulator [Nocardia huaxiensis]QLY33891.1 TetR/AcrR family transcriptional regulator [Nocardia huaxiensis]UFS99178.1 TetR/AcrR family transcriptional regulator [Nocardia huaxiensis]